VSEFGKVTLSPACKADFPRVLTVLEDAAAWLASRAIDQWRPGGFDRCEILQSIDRRELHLAQVDGRDVATIILQWSDPMFWPPEGHDQAGYVHKLAVRRASAGRGLGEELLDWAAARSAERGKRFLRLDCQGTNPGLCAYYEKLGFTRRGQKMVRTWQVALYEREVSPVARVSSAC
jgi:ribosomal protein S18 acetylase RimI-like enzyme